MDMKFLLELGLREVCLNVGLDGDLRGAWVEPRVGGERMARGMIDAWRQPEAPGANDGAMLPGWPCAYFVSQPKVHLQVVNPPKRFSVERRVLRNRTEYVVGNWHRR